MADARWPISRCRKAKQLADPPRVPRRTTTSDKGRGKSESAKANAHTLTGHGKKKNRNSLKKCFRFRVLQSRRVPRSASAPSARQPGFAVPQAPGWMAGTRVQGEQGAAAACRDPWTMRHARQGTVIPQCSRTRPQRRERERGQRRHRRRKSELLSRAGAARNRRVDKGTSICVSPATASPHRTPIRMLPSADPCQCPTARM